MIVCTTREFKQWWAPLSMLSPTSTKRTTTTNNLTKNKTGEDVISWKTCALSNCFSVVCVVRSLVFCVMFYRSLFIFLSFFLPLYCLSFNLRFLIYLLISKHSSCYKQQHMFKPTYHMTLQIQVLAWNGHNNVEGLN